MITKFNNFNLITENPDHIVDEFGVYHDFKDKDAIPFFIQVNDNHTSVKKIYFGKRGKTHSEIKRSAILNDKCYPGRVFLESKIIVFWVYPNDILFNSIINAIENELNIEMFDNGWRIEVIKIDDGFIKHQFKLSNDEYYLSKGIGIGKDKIMIPIEDYTGSDDVPKEEQIMHLMNWKEKELARKINKSHFGSVKTGWDASHNIKYRQKIYQEKHNLIKENPDHIDLDDDNYYSYEDYDAVPFFVEVNDDHTKVKKLHVGKYGDTHSDIKNSEDIEEKMYAGRLWKKIKIISFWVYPNDKLFLSIINALEKKLRIKILNNKWRIEVVKINNEIEKRDPSDDDYLFKGDFYNGTKRGFSHEDFIPIEEYIGSENHSDELRIQHMLNWKEKQKLNVNNFGSSKTAWDKPHNLKYRQVIYQENKKH